MQPDLVRGYRAILVALAELGHEAEARGVAEILRHRFAPQMRAFLSVRYPEFRSGDYAAYVASLAKVGVVKDALD